MKNVRTNGILVILITLIGIGCEKQEQISFYDAPKDPPPATAPVMAIAMADAANPRAGIAADPHATGPLTWTIPDGWQQKPGGEMRFATFLVNENPPVELTVIPLGGGPAGDIAANVNRWEGQLGLPPTPAEKLDSVVKKTSPNGLQVAAVDLKGEQQRMLAAIVPHSGRTWFFKLVGPGDVVEKQKASFDAFLASLKPAAPAMPAGAAPVAPAAGSMKITGFKAPDDWKEIPGSKAPRMIAFTVGPDDKKAELVATRFGQGKAGGMLDNVNRWRGQIGLPPVENMQNVAMTDTTAGKSPAILLEFDNPGGGDALAKRMLVALTVVGPDEWFFKLTGAPDAVDKQKAAFDGFLKSLEFAPEGDAK